VRRQERCDYTALLFCSLRLMKRILILVFLAIISPAIAQTDKSTLQTSKQPNVNQAISLEVLDVFDKAAFSYSGLASYSGDVRVEIENYDNDQRLTATTTGNFFYARKARLLFDGRIKAQLGDNATKLGVITYKSDGNRFQITQTGSDGNLETSPISQLNKTTKADPAWQNAPLDSLSPLLIAGINELRVTKDPLKGEILPSKTENGETFKGVRLTALSGELKGLEVVAYFDEKHHLLRDVTLSISVDGKPTKVRTIYSNLKFNPPISLNMFKIN
jgi:outer membrane lipoprotein-sorting protein